MRAIGKLFAVAAVVAILGFGQRIELLAGGALALVIVAVAIARSDRERAARSTIEVVALAPPAGLDVEGRTVPARMSPEDARAMHERYAPAFDQQLAVNRYIERNGDAEPDAADSITTYDPEAYAQARAYAAAFDAQLARTRRTMLYEAPRPPRLARGSEPHLEPRPSGWDPHKPASVTGMRRVK